MSHTCTRCGEISFVEVDAHEFFNYELIADKLVCENCITSEERDFFIEQEEQMARDAAENMAGTESAEERKRWN